MGFLRKLMSLLFYVMLLFLLSLFLALISFVNPIVLELRQRKSMTSIRILWV
ncbi:hypothetical protein RDABS01_032359 [Bienertia sinuspersici]